MPLAIVGAVISGIGVASSIAGGRKAEKAAKRASEEEARLEGLVTDEKIRQLELQERQLRGETIAQYAAAGVKVGDAVRPAGSRMLGEQRLNFAGSIREVLAEQQESFRAERDITEQVGATRASQALQRGSLLADQYKFSSYASAASQLGQAFSLLQTSNWYNKNWGSSAFAGTQSKPGST